MHGSWPRRDTTDDEKIRDDHERQDEEGTDAHRPAKSDLRDQLLDHDGENDTADRRARGGHAQREGSSSQEPRHHGGHGRVEDHGGTEGRAHALREDELVVRGGDGGHHQPEDVEEGPQKKEDTGTVVVWYIFVLVR